MGAPGAGLPERPDAIPYKTSYYREAWGFCLSHNQRDNLGDGPFEVCIDSSIKPGTLTYAQLVVPGSQPDEFLVSTQGVGHYIEHARELSDTVGVFAGIVVATILVLVINAIVERMERVSLRWRPVAKDMMT